MQPVRPFSRLAALRRSIAFTPALAGALLTLTAAPAAAATVTDAGEGFPIAMNNSDHIAVAGTRNFELVEGVEEESLEGPWSVWAAGKSITFLPLNGPGEGKEGKEGETPPHEIDLVNINDAGQVAATSPLPYKAKIGEYTKERAAIYSPAGAGEAVGRLQDTWTNKEGEVIQIGSLATGIDGAGDIVGYGAEFIGGEAKPRGFLAKGQSASVVGSADIPAGGGSEVYGVNSSGQMIGSAFDDEEGAETNRKFYIWNSPAASGTLLNFAQVYIIANDGSVWGERSGKRFLRTPDGKETEIAGLKSAYRMNSAHEIAGVVLEKGAEHAAVWRNGTAVDLNTLLPQGSGWVLQQAIDVNDSGDIAGVGLHEGKKAIFLLKPGLVVTSSKDTKEDPKASAGVCATEEGGCTLRAAIETVNKSAGATPTKVTFNVAGGKRIELAPATPLPRSTAPIELEGATQPGALEEGVGQEGRKIGVTIDGTKAAGNGLELEGADSVISGISIQKFTGDGILLKGEHEHVADSILYSDHTGVEVAGANDSIGPFEEFAGNNFVGDGSLAELTAHLQSLGSKHETPAENAEATAGFGACIYLGTAGASGAQITGNLIGLPGNLTALTPAPAISTADVLIDPAGGSVGSVTIGGPGAAKNLISFAIGGIEVLGDRGGSGGVAGASVLGNQIGGDRGKGENLSLGTIIGVLAAGKVSSLQVGSGAEGNTFPSDIAGTVLTGTELSGANVQGNTYGVDKGISSFEGGNLGGHDILGIVAADTTGAVIGGGAGQGNKVLGAPLGIILAGKHSTGNRVESNTIGRNAPPGGPFDLSEKSFDPGSFGGIVALLELNGAQQQIGSAGAGNTIQGNLLGQFSVEETDDRIQGNSFVKNAFGVFDLGSGGTQFGGSGAGQGNVVDSSAFGVFMANEEPTRQELETAQSGQKPASEEVRDATLKETPAETEALDEINGTSSAELTEAAFKVPSKPGTNNKLEGNLIGTDAAGNTKNAAGEPLGSSVGVLIAGDEHGVVVGGTGAGQGNQIVNDGSGGLLMAGTATHAPTVQILGDTIYNNSTFGGLAQGLPGLGVSLIRIQGSGEVDPTFGLSVNPQDPKQPDAGPNFLQNSPILSTATTSGGKLTVTGSLQTVANMSYTVELFSDTFKSPYGAGEGQTILGRFNVATDAGGHATFSATLPAPGALAQYVSAIATTLPASGGPGVSSEFALDVPITAGPVAVGPPPPPPGPSGPASTGIVLRSGFLTVTVSSVNLTLPGVVVECASASSTACTATATATEGTTGKASAAAMKKKHAPPVIARWSAKIAPGHAAKVVLTLTRQGFAQLKRKKTLALTVRVSVKAANGHTTTKLLHVKVKLRKKR